jgi:hypothetical protein
MIIEFAPDRGRTKGTGRIAMKPRSARQSAKRLTRAIRAGATLVSELDYRVRGVRAGDVLVYDKSAKPTTACGLVVVAVATGEMRWPTF